MAKNNVAIWLIVGAIVLVLSGAVQLPNFGEENEQESQFYPGDKTATLTLNTEDALESSGDTDANISYYVFDSSGKFIREGETESGTDDVSLPSNNEFDIILYDDDDSGDDYLPKEISVSIGGEGSLTENVELIKESKAVIEKIRDPVDLDSNVSVGAGQSINFDILISADASKAAVRNPVVVVDTNRTTFDAETTISGLSSTSCPDRLSSATNRRLECFEYDKMIRATDGTVSFSGSLQTNDNDAPSTSDDVEFTVIDQSIYKEPGYKTAGKSAFKYGAENPIANEDVGADDSDAASLYLNG